MLKGWAKHLLLAREKTVGDDFGWYRRQTMPVFVDTLGLKLLAMKVR